MFGWFGEVEGTRKNHTHRCVSSTHTKKTHTRRLVLGLTAPPIGPEQWCITGTLGHVAPLWLHFNNDVTKLIFVDNKAQVYSAFVIVILPSQHA